MSLSNEFKSALIGGVIGGLAFVIVSPLFTPLIYNAQVASGLVSAPTPTITADYSENVSEVTQSRYFVGLDSKTISSKSELTVFSITIENNHHKAIRDADFSIGFPGCYRVRALHPGISSEGVFGEVDSKYSRNSGCTEEDTYDFLHLGTIDPGEKAVITFIVDTRNVNRLEHNQIEIRWAFDWGYKDRIYSEEDVSIINSEEGSKLA